jgi:hypothetical protein
MALFLLSASVLVLRLGFDFDVFILDPIYSRTYLPSLLPSVMRGPHRCDSRIKSVAWHLTGDLWTEGMGPGAFCVQPKLSSFPSFVF